jgi:hypothetical protein
MGATQVLVLFDSCDVMMEAFELDIVPWSLYFDGLRPNIETDGPIDRSA